MPRRNQLTGVMAGLRLSPAIGLATLLMAASLAVLPKPGASAESNIQIAADESESDKDVGTDKSGSDKEEDEDKPDESGDKKRKSYQGSTEPSY